MLAPARHNHPPRSVVDASMSDEQSPTAYTSPLYISPEIEEKPDLPSLPAKVVSWDVAEEKEMANLKGEISKQKENMAVLENKATQLQEQLDRKVILAETNIASGVKVASLEYKMIALHNHCGYEEFASLKMKPRCGDFLLRCFGYSRPTLHENTKANAVYQDFCDTELKKLGEEGWTLRSIHCLGSSPIFKDYDPVWRSQTLYYFSRPL